MSRRDDDYERRYYDDYKNPEVVSRVVPRVAGVIGVVMSNTAVRANN